MRQVSFWVRDGDEERARHAMSDLTDLAWLRLYEAGVIEGRNDTARAAGIKDRGKEFLKND